MIKKTILLTTIILLIFSSCKNPETSPKAPQQELRIIETFQQLGCEQTVRFISGAAIPQSLSWKEKEVHIQKFESLKGDSDCLKRLSWCMTWEEFVECEKNKRGKGVAGGCYHLAGFGEIGYLEYNAMVMCELIESPLIKEG